MKSYSSAVCCLQTGLAATAMVPWYEAVVASSDIAAVASAPNFV